MGDTEIANAANLGELDVVTAVMPGLLGGAVALLTVIVLVIGILKCDTGNQRMVDIAEAIQIGARAFLVREYSYLAIFVAIVAVLLAITTAWQTAVCFAVGASLSALCGWIGMSMAVRANVRTAAAARNGLNPALRVAFKSGAVMGLIVVGLGILGLGIMFLVFSAMEGEKKALQSIAGFGFGASSIALFARVGGGIFTKAADVGADLVGKVEAGIPEDDPRNPAVIADNVGDNVGDVAGMGADLFESYVGSIIAAATLGSAYINVDFGDPEADLVYLQGIGMPFWISGLGIICSIVGCFMVRTKEGASQENLLAAIRTGIFGASALVVACTAFVVNAIPGQLQHRWMMTRDEEGNTLAEPMAMAEDKHWAVFLVVIIGLVAGIMIGTATEYYTSFAYEPTKSIARSSNTGPATIMIQGLGVGMISCIAPVFTMVFAIMGSYMLLGEFGVAISAVGMLATLGVTLATDAYGPVADNAGGIAEMAELPEEVRERTDALDALGNTTAATGKGFAIGSAVLTALALMSAFTKASGLECKDDSDKAHCVRVNDPTVMAGVLIGALLPFVFASLTMLSVGKSAMAIIEEVRHQFHTIPGLMEGTGKPQYDRCVAISTQAAVREMVLPGGMAVASPVVCGLILGAKGLAGLLTGSISAGFLLAVTMANAGGAWDNSKKWVEAGGLGEGKGKGSEEHKAAVVGDTVGDPFKDTSGPALNILIKLMSIISLVLAQNGFFPTEPFAEGLVTGLIVLAVCVLLAGGFLVYNRKKSHTTFREYEMMEGGSSEEHQPMTSAVDDGM